MRYTIRCLVVFSALVLMGCERSADKSKSPTTKPAGSKPADEHKAGDGHEQGADDGHGHEEATDDSGHSGEVIELGTTKIGQYSVRASRDKGELKPGGDAPVDVWVDGSLGEGVTAVRFWIGTGDAKGSVKAKAAVEDGKWHTHVEIPDPLPADSALWIELESAAGVSRGSVPI